MRGGRNLFQLLGLYGPVSRILWGTVVSDKGRCCHRMVHLMRRALVLFVAEASPLFGTVLRRVSYW